MRLCGASFLLLLPNHYYFCKAIRIFIFVHYASVAQLLRRYGGGPGVRLRKRQRAKKPK